MTEWIYECKKTAVEVINVWLWGLRQLGLFIIISSSFSGSRFIQYVAAVDFTDDTKEPWGVSELVSPYINIVLWAESVHSGYL